MSWVGLKTLAVVVLGGAGAEGWRGRRFIKESLAHPSGRCKSIGGNSSEGLRVSGKP